LLTAAIPGLTGDSASARWPAIADAISSAATAPNERRAKTEIVDMDIVLPVATAKQNSQTSVTGAFKASFSTCDIFSWIGFLVSNYKPLAERAMNVRVTV
jgi:hypothetical protein